MATEFDEAEVDLNEGPRRIHQLVAATATATSAMSTNTSGRMENEHNYLQKCMRILEKQRDEVSSVGCEIVVTEERRRCKYGGLWKK